MFAVAKTESLVRIQKKKIKYFDGLINFIEIFLLKKNYLWKQQTQTLISSSVGNKGYRSKTESILRIEEISFVIRQMKSIVPSCK